MTKAQQHSILLPSKQNPLLYSVPICFSAFAILATRDFTGILVASFPLGALAAWWLFRVHYVTISFESKEATFFYSALNPFRKSKVISLANFSRVYATPFYKNGGWSIHVSGPRGQHLLLTQIPEPLSGSSTDENVRRLCTQIASGLNIKDGGGA
ncbi:MAG: hypothetical protein KDF24_02115 [Rhodocyclaceae bacterium]|nr:hypothetical protein [Rhodocyclaceae bacterium]